MKKISSNSFIRRKEKLRSFFDFSVLSINDNGRKLSFFGLFIPKLCELLFAKFTATLNTLLISDYAEDAVGATTAATQIITIFNLLLGITSVGATILVSIELGRGDQVRAGRIVATSLITILVTSGAVSVLLLAFAEPLLTMLNLEGDALVYGTTYLRIRGGMIFLPTVSAFLGTMLICNGKAVHAMISGMLSNSMNLLGMLLLLRFRVIPALSGTAAIAVATELACLTSIIYCAIVFCKCRCPFVFRFDKSVFLKTSSLGAMGSISGFAYTFAITITVGFIGALGIVSLNAYSYTNSVVGYAALFSSVVSSCISVFVGRYAGRGDVISIKKIVRLMTAISVAVNTVFSLIILALREPLLSLFTNNGEILSMCLVIFAIDVLIEGLRGVVHVMEAAMNASRNVIITLISGIVSAWLAIVLFSYILGIVCGLGLVGFWIAFALSELLKSVVYLVYFKSGRWTKTII